jgi:hypothetical protein
VDVGERIDGDDRLVERIAAAQVVRRALRRGDDESGDLLQLVGRQLLLPDPQSRPGAHAVRQHDLGGRAHRAAGGTEQLGRRVPAERATPLDEKVGRPGEQFQIDNGVDRHVDVREQAAEARAAQHCGGEQTGGDRVGAAEGLGEVHDLHGRPLPRVRFPGRPECSHLHTWVP